MEQFDIAVIGGGAAGLIAAGSAAASGARIALVEKNEVFGKKLYITGKGRCNVTNSADMSEFFQSIPVNSRFLYSAFSAFTNEDLLRLLREYGVATKTERGGRVFPASDKSSDVIRALKAYALQKNVTAIQGAVTELLINDGVICGVKLVGGKEIAAKKVIVATGGKSYPQTGSTGDGYRFAKQAGHTVVIPRPSLVPLVTKEKWPADMMGLSLKNAAISMRDTGGKEVYSDFGEMLFTHYGVSGPMILSASAHLRDIGTNSYSLLIDLKPALDSQTLDKRILRDFSESKNRDFGNSLGKLLPKKLIPVIVSLSKINPHKKVNEVTRGERARLTALFKGLPLTVTGTRPIGEAIITSGGVHVKEINPKTMESKLVGGLYFAGEVLDVDAYTGGFNLQIAFSTGFLAGREASWAL